MILKIFLLLCFTALTVVNGRPGCPGCVTRLTGNKLQEAESTLSYSLRKLADRDGPYYRLIKINTATIQVVAGIKHVINADLIDNINNQMKTCRITIWSQPWLPTGTEVHFECPGEENLTEEEANETLKYVFSKYEEVEMKIIGEPVSIYGLRLSYGDTEEELNIHFKYIDNTQQDIIQNCVFALYHRQNECELIKTICNTFLPITPRPLVQRQDLRICDNGSDVQLVEQEEDGDEEETTIVTTTDSEQVVQKADDVDGSENNVTDDGNGEQEA